MSVKLEHILITYILHTYIYSVYLCELLAIRSCFVTLLVNVCVVLYLSIMSPVRKTQSPLREDDMQQLQIDFGNRNKCTNAKLMVENQMCEDNKEVSKVSPQCNCPQTSITALFMDFSDTCISESFCSASSAVQ